MTQKEKRPAANGAIGGGSVTTKLPEDAHLVNLDLVGRLHKLRDEVKRKERALIGSLLRYGRREYIPESLEPRCNRLSLIVEAMRALEEPTILNVCERMAADGSLTLVGGPGEVSSLTTEAAELAPAKMWHQLASMGVSISRDGADKVEQLLREADCALREAGV